MTHDGTVILFYQGAEFLHFYKWGGPLTVADAPVGLLDYPEN